MKRSLSTLCISTLAGVLVLTPGANATQSGTPAARASGESAGASVEVTATLASGAVVIAPSAAVIVMSTGATLVTGDPAFIEEGAEYAEDMLAWGFGMEPLDISDEVVVAPPPDVPYEAQRHDND